MSLLGVNTDSAMLAVAAAFRQHRMSGSLQDLTCHAMNKAGTDHCRRAVTWAIDTPKGVLFMCNTDYEKYTIRHDINPDCIVRLCDNDEEFQRRVRQPYKGRTWVRRQKGTVGL